MSESLTEFHEWMAHLDRMTDRTLTLTEVLAVWGITLNERQAVQLLAEMKQAVDE